MLLGNEIESKQQATYREGTNMGEEAEGNLTPDEQSLFYYAECPSCSMKFAVWNRLNPTSVEIENLGEERVQAEEGDITVIYCPRCGQSFPLEVSKVPKVYLTWKSAKKTCK